MSSRGARVEGGTTVVYGIGTTAPCESQGNTVTFARLWE